MLGDGIWEGLRLYDGVWAFFDELRHGFLILELDNTEVEVDRPPLAWRFVTPVAFMTSSSFFKAHSICLA